MKWFLPSTLVLRDPYKGILSSAAGGQGWAPDNLLEKSSLLAPQIPRCPPQSWSVPIEGGQNLPAGSSVPLRRTHCTPGLLWPALARHTSLSGDSILLLRQPQIPFALCAAVCLLFSHSSPFLTRQPAKLLPVPAITCSCWFLPPGLCRCCPGCPEWSFPSPVWKLLCQAPAHPSIFLQVATIF